MPWFEEENKKNTKHTSPINVQDFFSRINFKFKKLDMWFLGKVALTTSYVQPYRSLEPKSCLILLTSLPMPTIFTHIVMHINNQPRAEKTFEIFIFLMNH